MCIGAFRVGVSGFNPHESGPPVKAYKCTTYVKNQWKPKISPPLPKFF